jgi:glycosyltransferase involved in cell wall biosynthesis
MKQKILFYSSVKNRETFYTHFYKMDIEILEDLGFEVELCNSAKPFLSKKYDIAFLYFYRKSLLPCLLARLFRKNVFFTGGIDDLNKETTSLQRYLIQYLFFLGCYIFSTKCIVISNGDLQNIYKVIGKDFLNKLVIVPSCLYKDTEDYFVERIKEDIFTTICFFEHDANFFRKGIDKALTVFAVLQKYPEFADYKLYIIGKHGKNNHLLQKYISDLKLRNVIVTDSISDKEKYDILSRSKYYFQLSMYEGFGLAALEALYFKNIVIHSNKGGLSDFMKDFGIIYDEKNDTVNSLYEKIKDRDEKYLKQHVSEWVLSRFSYKVRKTEISKVIFG